MMDFIHGGRASGKTTLLIRQSAATGIPIMTTNYHRIAIYKNYAKDMGLRIPHPVFWRNRPLGLKPGSKVLIDNGEETLNCILLVNSGVVCESMVIDSPIKHLTNCFLDDPGVFPEEMMGGRLEFLDAAVYGAWDDKEE